MREIAETKDALLIASAAPGQTLNKKVARQAPGKAAQEPTECHILAAKLNDITVRFDPLEQRKTNIPEPQQMARMHQLADWQEQLGECVVQKPEQLSVKDWQLAIFTYARLQEELDKISAESALLANKDATKALSDIYKDNDQQRLDD